MNMSEKLAKANQEQAVAAWINHLNQLRLETLVEALANQKTNLQEALQLIDSTMDQISHEVIERNRGGLKGMHGFIAEVAETGVDNARKMLNGLSGTTEWINNNGPADLLRDGTWIQQKFWASGAKFGLDGISKHLESYPDFLASGGKYQIPADQYEVVARLYGMSASDAGKLLSRSGGGQSFSDWQRIQEFFKDGQVDFQSIEASHHNYRDVQSGRIAETLKNEKESLKVTDKEIRDQAYSRSKPQLPQAARATAVAAVNEGALTLVVAIGRKTRQGTQLKDFTKQDWQEILGEAGLGASKGGTRGISIYLLSNFSATPASVANALVTTSFGIADQAHLLRQGAISEIEFIENSQMLALETAISALSSLLGQSVIPVPILGAVIGNTVGCMLFSAMNSAQLEREAKLIEEFFKEQQLRDARYEKVLSELDRSVARYLEIIDDSFSPDLEIALQGSVNLALSLGVPAGDVLDSREKTDSYFLD